MIKTNEIYAALKNYGIIPVIKINDENKAEPLADALTSGGLPVAEITFRTNCAAQAIQKIAYAFPHMIVAAGTVLTVSQVKAAVDAGAQLIVSPGFNDKVAAYCQRNNIPMIPGCTTPGDIEKALDMNITVVKFFPAEAYGGLKTIKALSAPYSNVSFVPTGGIDDSNLVEYLSHKSVIACGGSFMVKEEDIANGNFEKIKTLTERTIYNMLGFDLAHIAMNCENAEKADDFSDKIEHIFGIRKSDEDTHISNGGIINFMKNKSYGKNGQIAISTNFIERAMFYLKSRQTAFIEESARFDAKGEMTSVYLENMINGFAVRLVRK